MNILDKIQTTGAQCKYGKSLDIRYSSSYLCCSPHSVRGLAHLPEDGLVVHMNYARDQVHWHQAFLSQLCQTVQKTLKEICDQW